MRLAKQRSVGLWVLLCGLWALPCEAQTARTEHTVRLDEGTERPAASISDVAWLSGRWVGQGLDATAEESWLPPAAGRMVGVFRLVRGDSVEFYELVTLVEEEESLVLRLKHVGPDLAGWEEKAGMRQARVSLPRARPPQCRVTASPGAGRSRISSVQEIRRVQDDTPGDDPCCLTIDTDFR